MGFRTGARVKETTTTTGTGTLQLAGAVAKFRTFVAGVGDTSRCAYYIVDAATDEFERGSGTVADSAPDTLTRDQVFESSNGGSKVVLQTGTKDVFIDFSPELMAGPYLDVVAKSGVHTILAAEHDTIIDVDASAAAVTITLPLLADVWIGYTAAVTKNENSVNAVTVDGNGAELINGSADLVLGLKNAFAQFTKISATKWEITEFNPGDTAGFFENHVIFTDGAVTDPSGRNTTAGTYTVPKGLRFAIIRVKGGGGAGGRALATSSATSSSGSGGGEGGESSRLVRASEYGATETVTIGAGGLGSSVATGGNGGTTTITVTNGTPSTIQATGGTGSNGNNSNSFFSNAGAVGGVGSNGDINLDGEDGGPSFGTGSVSANEAAFGGNGGGPGGRSGSVSSSGQAAGLDGGKYGGGGGGSANSASQAAVKGGDGFCRHRRNSGVLLMKRILLDTGRGTLHDIVVPGDEFPVDLPLKWIGAPDEITQGWIWDGAKPIPPPEEALDEVKRQARNEISHERDRRIATGVMFNGAQFDADDKSRANLVASVAFLRTAADEGIPTPATIPWRDADDADHAFSLSELVQLATVIFTHVETVYQASWTLKDQVKAAVDNAAARAVKWP